MKRIILVTISMLLVSLSTYPQFSSSFYHSVSSSKVGIGYFFNDRIFSEVRLYGGLSIDNFTAEPIVTFNFCQKEVYNAYVGTGMVINYLTGPVFPLGVYIKPFESLRKFRICIEAEPMYDIDNEVFLFNCSAGFVYSFQEK